MALKFADLVFETTLTTGTGGVVLRGAGAGFQTFAAGIGDGQSCYYVIRHVSLNQWEVGLGTVHVSGGVTTLNREAVLASSNANALVSFSAGPKEVRNTVPAAVFSGIVPNDFEPENKDSVSLWPGAVVAQHSSGSGVIRASALDKTKVAIGLSVESPGATFAGKVQTSQLFSLDDWTAVIGSANLAPKATYFLSVTLGKLSASPPTSPGQIVQQVGVAVSPTILELLIQPPILL